MPRPQGRIHQRQVRATTQRNRQAGNLRNLSRSNRLRIQGRGIITRQGRGCCQGRHRVAAMDVCKQGQDLSAHPHAAKPRISIHGVMPHLKPQLRAGRNRVRPAHAQKRTDHSAGHRHPHRTAPKTAQQIGFRLVIHGVGHPNRPTLRRGGGHERLVAGLSRLGLNIPRLDLHFHTPSLGPQAAGHRHRPIRHRRGIRLQSVVNTQGQHISPLRQSRRDQAEGIRAAGQPNQYWILRSQCPHCSTQLQEGRAAIRPEGLGAPGHP